MPRYKIIGTDLKEYGPVSAEEIRMWIAEDRVDADTRLQAEGTSEWKRLAELAEFSEAPPGARAWTCPACGEKIEAAFDACWKCGTGRDGSHPRQFTPSEGDSPDERRCPNCGSPNVKPGELMGSGKSASVVFRPEGTRFFSFSLYGGVPLDSEGNCACLECGLVWAYVPADKLKQFILNHGRGSGQEVCDALLSEAAQLESAGDMSGALAKYETVLQQFEETPVKKEVEQRIQDLRAKM